MRNLIIFLLFVSHITLFSQNFDNQTLVSTNKNYGETSFKSEYQISSILHLNTISVNNTTMHIPQIQGSGYLQQKGKPALPSFSEIFALESDSVTFTFQAIESDTIDQIVIFPWIGHAVDLQGIPSPEFIIDSVFYNSDVTYPNQNIQISDRQTMNGHRLAVVTICPFEYNPLKQILIIHKRFSIEMKQYEKIHLTSQQNQRSVTSQILKNIICNKEYFDNPESKNNHIENAQNYLIITHPDYIDAARNIAKWREQTGYKTEILSSYAWGSTSIRQAIFNRYYSENQISYVLLLGDHNKVPGSSLISHLGVFPTDRPYAYMDGPNDYFPDIAIGRISVNSAQDAMNVTEKIIGYEKEPVTQQDFYNNALSVAYFQDDNNNNYADRRFAQTAEEILQYLNTLNGKNVNRIYYTNSSTTPLYWNNTYYSAGEPVPTHLLKPGFPWNGNYNNIISGINSGAFLVYHRDHGSDQGWGDPAFNITNVHSLNNGNKLPVVASVNCQTGKFLTTECFAEAFLRHSSGGAVGVFAHAEVSYSGYNDALSMGLIDAIFAQPGLIPNFTGSGHFGSTLTQHDPILTLGDVANQALLRMTQTWGDGWGYEQYQSNIFHYFGDPATRIFTQTPVVITSVHQSSVQCTDTSFSLHSCNIPDALATLTSDNKLIGLTTLQNGSGTISFKPTASNNIILTITAPNTKPYIQTITAAGNCVIADFETTEPTQPCTGSPVIFQNLSTGYYTDLLWNFGLDATPQIMNGNGPHAVHFSQSGLKNITLIAVSPLGNDTTTQQLNILPSCSFVMPPFGYYDVQSCSGILKDNGSDLPYLSDSESQVLIHSSGANQIELTFSLFDIQTSTGCNSNFIQIFSGEPLSGTLIGTYCNSNPPPVPLIIMNDSVGLYFVSAQNPGFLGFEMVWQCVTPGIAPSADFGFEFADHCGHIIQFLDNSLYQPNGWNWDFGDGNTSNLQHPQHEYLLNGTYDIQLITSNQYGTDTIIYPGLITVNRPQTLNDSILSICRLGNIQIPSGNGQAALWYDNPNTLQPMAYTEVLDYYADSPVVEIFCRNYIPNGSYQGGKPDNSGTGGYFNSSVVHFLGFDIYQPLNLKAVTVYAQDNGNRTIRVIDGNDNTVYTSTHYLITGPNRVELNYILLPDNDYKIDAGQYCKLYRNGSSSGNNLDYPFTTPGLLSINRSSAGYPNASKYYYFFYDWEVEPLCLSAPASKEIHVEISDTTIQAWPGHTLCSADSILLGGLNNGSYLWIPCGDTTSYMFVDQSGLYSAMIESNGCFASTNTIEIEGEIFPHAEFTYTLNGLEINLTNTSTGNSFHWMFGDENESFDEHPVHFYAQEGTYNITLIAENICGTDTFSQQINVTETGILSGENNTIMFFPNPAHDYLHIQLVNLTLSQPEEIRIYNLTGQLIDVINIQGVTNNIISIPIHHIAPGIYFAIIQTETDIMYGKFIRSNDASY